MLAVLNEEQVMLANTARTLGSAVGIRNPQELDSVDDAKVWAALADTGLLGLRRRDEGAPLASGVEAMVVAHELGAALTTAPFITSGVLAVELLELAGVGDELAEPVATGGVRVGLLLSPSLLTLADPDDTGAVLVGRATCDYALALRRTPDGGGQVVRVATEGAFAELGQTDLTTAVSTRVAGGGSENVGTPVSAADMKRWTALALTLVSADCAGAMRSGLDGVVEYAKHRIAYGVPIGSFQALQHLCADAFAYCEGAVTTNNYAAWAVDALDPDDALLAGRTAKAWVASVAREVTETVMQVYGGIGQTWEHIAHVHARRALFDTALFGHEGHQLDEIFAMRNAQRAGGEH